MAAACEPLLRPGWICSQRKLLACIVVHGRVFEDHLRQQSVLHLPIPGDVLPFRVLNRNRPDRAGRLERFPTQRVVMRIQRAGDSGRDACEEDNNLAFHVEAGKIVVLQFGDGQPVAGKYHRRLKSRCVQHAQREEDIGTELDALLGAVAHDRQVDLPSSSVREISFTGCR